MNESVEFAVEANRLWSQLAAEENAPLVEQLFDLLGRNLNLIDLHLTCKVASALGTLVPTDTAGMDAFAAAASLSPRFETACNRLSRVGDHEVQIKNVCGVCRGLLASLPTCMQGDLKHLEGEFKRFRRNCNWRIELRSLCSQLLLLLQSHLPHTAAEIVTEFSAQVLKSAR